MIAISFSRLFTRPPSPQSSLSRNSAPRICAAFCASASRIFASPRVPISPCVRSTMPNRLPAALARTSVPAHVSSMSSGCAAMARMSTAIGGVSPQLGHHGALERPGGRLANRVERGRAVREHRNERRVEPFRGPSLRKQHRVQPPAALVGDLVLALGGFLHLFCELLELIRHFLSSVFERAHQ